MAEGILARGLTLSAPDGRGILDGVSLTLKSADRAWIEGAPGSGKRALLKVLAGLLPPDAGEVSLGGIRLWPGEGAAALRGRIRTGFAFAQGGLLSNQTLKDNLMLPLRFTGRGVDGLDEVLDRYGLLASASLRPHALGARARRLAQFARIELFQPQVIFLAEPFEDLEGPDLDLVRAAIRQWAQDPERLMVLSAETADPALLPDATRFRLEAGRIHSAGVSP